jgi:hypothetical protein
MWLLLYKVLNEFVDSGISMDSNKLVEKLDGDIFPEEFNENVYRKDTKSDHHGGIFVAIKTTFDSEEAEELKIIFLWGMVRI